MQADATGQHTDAKFLMLWWCMQVIRIALLDGECEVDRLAGLQLHGTGTSLGDPIEMGAACAVVAHRHHTGQ